MRARRPRSRGAPPPGARLWPSSWRYGRQGGGVLHRRETERNATAVHAGGTPALPGGRLLLGLGFGQAHGVTAGRVAGCYTAGKLSGTLRRCMRAGRPRSRGAASSWDSASAKPMALHRQGGGVLHRREAERQATGVHAGGTPALPGGASSHHSCCSRGHEPAYRAAVLPLRSSSLSFSISRNFSGRLGAPSRPASSIHRLNTPIPSSTCFRWTKASLSQV